jgi:hypothetical protein
MAQRLAEHLVADARRRPAPAHDVLVEPLPGPDAQGEAAVVEQRRGGRRLGDDRRVVAEVVVADLDEVEPGLLGPDRLGDQLLGREHLGEQLVPDPHRLLLVGSIPAPTTPAAGQPRMRA